MGTAGTCVLFGLLTLGADGVSREYRERTNSKFNTSHDERENLQVRKTKLMVTFRVRVVRLATGQVTLFFKPQLVSHSPAEAPGHTAAANN